MKTKLRQILYLYLVIGFLPSCGNSTRNNEDDHVNFYLTEGEDMDDSITFSSLDLIPLEDQKEGMLSRVNKFEISPNGFLIFDDSSVPLIARFDANGKFLNKIGSVGHGKDEFANVRDVTETLNGDTIFVSSGSKMMAYNKGGRLLFSKDIFDFAGEFNHIQSYNDGLICESQYTNSSYIIHFMDKQIDVISEQIDSKNEYICGLGSMTMPIKIYNDKILYYNHTTSSFSLFSDCNIQKYTLFELHSPNIMTLDIAKNRNEFYKVHDFVSNFYFYDDNTIAGNMIYDQGSIYNFVFKLKEKSFNIYKSHYWMPDILCTYNGECYAVIEPSLLLDIINDKILMKDEIKELFKTSFKKLDKEISELSNYIVVKFSR